MHDLTQSLDYCWKQWFVFTENNVKIYVYAFWFLVYPVQLDTGSSDLFIHGNTSPLPGTQGTVSIVHHLNF
jgi:hypothetical protein